MIIPFLPYFELGAGHMLRCLTVFGSYSFDSSSFILFFFQLILNGSYVVSVFFGIVIVDKISTFLQIFDVCFLLTGLFHGLNTVNIVHGYSINISVDDALG